MAPLARDVASMFQVLSDAPGTDPKTITVGLLRICHSCARPFSGAQVLDSTLLSRLVWWVQSSGSWPTTKEDGCGSKPMVPFWARCTTHWCTIWILTHGQVVPLPKSSLDRGCCRPCTGSGLCWMSAANSSARAAQGWDGAGTWNE